MKSFFFIFKLFHRVEQFKLFHFYKYLPSFLSKTKTRLKTLKILHLPYENRLEILCLTDLKTIRERGDFIQIYKIVHGLEKVNWCDENKIIKPDQKTAGPRHTFQLCRDQTREYELRTQFLLNKMATPWNSLTMHLHTL